MDVKEAIMTRRAYRSFVPVTITRELVEDLAGAAGLAPSCNNNQPWRFVFVYGPEALGTASRGALGRKPVGKGLVPHHCGVCQERGRLHDARARLFPV